MIDHPTRIFRFGLFEADLQTAELRKNGLRVPLQGQPFQVFAILLENAGNLVTREQLRSQIWPRDTFVDFDHALNTAITKIRAALGDDADNPRFVETLPRRGYRFIGPVNSPKASLESTNLLPVSPEGRNRTWLGAGAVFLVVVSAAGVWWLRRDLKPAFPIEVVPLIGLRGLETAPRFSPDGSQASFAMKGPEDFGIYTAVIGSAKPLRLTDNHRDNWPRWSPDGRQIAFIRESPSKVEIYVTAALGGTERQLYSGPADAFCPAFDWSPDGKELAISEVHADRTHAHLALLSLADSTTRAVTSPSDQEIDYAPAFSPDGRKVAFVRSIVAGVVSDLYVVPVAGGQPNRLTFDRTWIMGAPAWTPDGREIVFSSTRGGLASLWRVVSSGGTPEPVAGVGAVATHPSVSSKGTLAYEQWAFQDEIWELNLQSRIRPDGLPRRLVSEKGSILRPQFSPDRKRIVFESDRTGYKEIWACDSNGSNCSQLTSLRGTAGAARWSPDGRYIAFEFRPKEHSEIYLLDVNSGVPRLLPTLPGADNGGPDWSRDGKSIYFYSDRGGGPFQLWKMRVDGGTPAQLTRNGGVFAAESADGRFLYYIKLETPGVWRMPLNGGTETRILDQPTGWNWWNWAVAGGGIYFFGANAGGKLGVNFFDFSSRKTTSLSTAKEFSLGLALSSDGRSILYVQHEWANSSIMLVNNFR
jgi:Tol biopolymer transport system component/DNA-binding winged helix-turn-helix (wHTH) protein